MNSELLYITKKLGYPSSFGLRSGVGDFLEQYPDGIYAENGGGAPMGWESAAVWFGGDSERAASRFERMMSERNELSRIFRTRVSGVLVLTFIYRLKSRMVTAIPIGRAQPAIDPTWLYFTMPEGGTVTLTKNGTPTAVTLEYSMDNGASWTEWIESGNERTVTLAAGQTVHIRNTSETSTGFSTSSTNYYNFAFTTDTYAGGNTNSLLCKIPSSAASSTCCFYKLFSNCATLISAPTLPLISLSPHSYAYMFSFCSELIYAPLLPATTIGYNCYDHIFENCSSLNLPSDFTLPATNLTPYCYYAMFIGCENLILPENFILLATTLETNSYAYMFRNCHLLDKITTNMTDISATSCLAYWLSNVSPTGDFYCPAELTIPTGVSGIPSGWTRHDLPTT